jgi:hypothetical protein
VSTCRHQLAACHGAPAPSSSSSTGPKAAVRRSVIDRDSRKRPTSMHAALGASKAGTLQTSISVQVAWLSRLRRDCVSACSLFTWDGRRGSIDR